ncbi:MAG: phosphatidylinositol alpha-mannosyltransferase, partial [Frankiales bacterium]|nr:phosphatidylinositol alpha-mannosyltransferase [Frankiales bacterium]
HLLAPALRGRLDVWHATSTGDAAAASLAGGRVRSVFTDHGFPARRSRAARPDHRLHDVVVRHVDSYVCVSQAAGACLRTDYGRTPDVVPPGVRCDAHAPAPRSPVPVLLYAGSLVEERKGLPLLLEAAALLRADEPALEVWLSGQGDAGPLLAAAPAAARAAVTRCGPLDDAALRDAYARAWVMVLPSRAESFGMTVVESLASGTPAVVLRDGGGPPEVVDDDAVGRRADATPADLARACAEALELARRPGTVEACRTHARRYDWDAAVVPALERLYAA